MPLMTVEGDEVVIGNSYEFRSGEVAKIKAIVHHTNPPYDTVYFETEVLGGNTYSNNWNYRRDGRWSSGGEYNGDIMRRVGGTETIKIENISDALRIFDKLSRAS